MRRLFITAASIAALVVPTAAIGGSRPTAGQPALPGRPDMHADVTTEGQFKGSYVGEYAPRATHNGGTLSAAAHNGDVGVQYALSLEGKGSLAK